MIRCSAVSIAFVVFLNISAVSHAAEVTVEEGITYSKAGDQELKLDLAKPDGDGPFPAIVFIHGGGWLGGDRAHFRPLAEEAAKRGYVGLTISYRLMKFDQEKKETTTAEPIFPAQIHDCKAAVRWLRAHADKYHVDKNWIGVAGGSAGGHLSLLVGLTDKSDKLEGEGGYPEESSRVQAVVNIFGPTEMASCHAGSSVAWIFRLFMGGNPDETPETYKAASPVTYVTKDDPPILTLHGDKDALVPVEQAKLLDEKLQANGVEHELLILEGQGHGFGGEAQKQAMNALWRFFDQHLKPQGG
ncbi:MAG: alpha/beta hydrolase [Planctomycetes bacterium]|nr:alpha/beta hydrolase [Planctomycetota bacterium]